MHWALPGNLWPKSRECRDRSHGYSGNSLGPGAGGRGVPRCGICPSSTGGMAAGSPGAPPWGSRVARCSAWGTCSPGREWSAGAATWWASEEGTDVETSGWMGSGIRTCGLCTSFREPMGLLGLGLPRGDPGEGGGDPRESTPPRPTILSMEKPSLGRAGVWMTVEGVGIMTLLAAAAAVQRRRPATRCLPRSAAFSPPTHRLCVSTRQCVIQTHRRSLLTRAGTSPRLPSTRREGGQEA